MKWSDHGIILLTRPLGENSRILTLFTSNYGRHAGLIKVPKARSRLNIEPGTLVEATWYARLPEHLGQWNLEIVSAIGSKLLSLPLPLTALSSACNLTDQCLPERHPYPKLYHLLKELIESFAHTPDWLVSYVNYELALLKHLGFGLDLSVCAATGQKEDLAYISPKTGRAVSREAGKPYKTQLLPLPHYWIDETAVRDIRTALMVTSHFLNQHLAGQQGLPTIRQRLVEMVTRTL